MHSEKYQSETQQNAKIINKIKPGVIKSTEIRQEMFEAWIQRTLLFRTKHVNNYVVNVNVNIFAEIL